MPIYECRHRNEYGDEVGFEVTAGSLRNASIEAKRILRGKEFILVVVKEEELVKA